MDETGRHLLRLLQKDGRMTNVDLARQADLSQTEAFERVRRLQRDGVIEGFTAILNPVALDRGLLVFVELVLERTNAGVFADLAEAVRRAPEILECHMVAGGFDYLIKARVKDMAAYRAFLGGTLAAVPGVRQTHTYAVMEEVKSAQGFPV